MSYNIICTLHKKSDAPGEKAGKASGDLDDIKQPLVTNNDTVDIKEISRKMWLIKPTHILYQQKRILTQSTKVRYNKHPNK